MEISLACSRGKRRRGSALLAVLWLSSALAAIAFSVAVSVRGETSHARTSEEDLRASYLAEGAVQRAILHLQWSETMRGAEGVPFFVPGQPAMHFDFPSGVADVEVVPESSKLSLNAATPEALAALLVNLGQTPEQAAVTAAAIVDWRTPRPASELSAFDELYLSAQPSFRASHASFHDVGELLSVHGVTPDLYYGSWTRVGEGDDSRLVPREALRDCVSPWGSTAQFDVNSVRPAVLAAVGVPSDFIQALVEHRRTEPFLRREDLLAFTGNDLGLLNRLIIGTHTLYTLRATARPRQADGSLSDLRRSVAATVKLLPPGFVSAIGPRSDSFHILRWYDRG